MRDRWAAWRRRWERPPDAHGWTAERPGPDRTSPERDAALMSAADEIAGAVIAIRTVGQPLGRYQYDELEEFTGSWDRITVAQLAVIARQRGCRLELSIAPAAARR